MSEQTDLAHRFYREVMSEGNLDAVDELCAEDFVEHEEFPGLTPDREGVKGFVTMFRGGFPDLHVEVEEILESEDKVVARIRMQGTHNGEFMGIPASGKKIDVPCIDVVRIADGRAAEHRGITDGMALMQQIGAVPEGAPA